MIKVSGSQEIEIEDIIGISADPSYNGLDLTLDISGGYRVTVSLEPKLQSKESFAKELYEAIDAVYGFSDENYG